MKCPLCSFEFNDQDACKGCGLLGIGGCVLIRCPNCGYEFAEKSYLVDFIKRLFGKKKKENRWEI